MRRAGLALLVVLGVLAVLAVLATAFATMARLERRASAQRVYAAKAELLARSGLEDALARLGAGQDPEAAANAYGGEDWNGNGVLDAGTERGAQSFQAGTLNAWDCPLRCALRPSYFARDASSGGYPALLPADGKARGFSGRLSGDRGPTGDTYALRVVREDGFFVNGGDLRSGGEHAGTYDTQLRRMLGLLAEAVDRQDGADDGRPVDRSDGEALVLSRPGGGWQAWEEIRDRALGGSRPRLDALRPYLTLHAWADRKVIRPNPEASMIGQPCLSVGSGVLLAHARTRAGSRAPDFERDGAGTVVGRAPVSLAWARSRRPALLALLGGIRAVYLEESSGTSLGHLRQARIEDGLTPPAKFQPAWDDAGEIANRLMAWPGAIATWEQWDAFCDSIAYLSSTDPENLPPYLPSSVSAEDLRLAKVSALKANFRPGSVLNKFNPDASTWRPVDKSDLLDYSTELSLESLNPVGIACVGRVLGPDGRLLASRTLSATLAGPEAFRLATQREWCAQNLGNLETAGDEGPPRIPGAAAYLSRSAGAGRTWGHTVPFVGGLGLGLQTYPEPCTLVPPAAVAPSPADCDGGLKLATVDTVSGDVYGVTATTADMTCLARFTLGLDLDVHDGSSGANQPDAAQAAASASVWHDTAPGTLRPDGCYSEYQRAPAYLSAGNVPGFHGAISFWVKPNYLGRSPRYVEQSPLLGTESGDFQAMGPPPPGSGGAWCMTAWGHRFVRLTSFTDDPFASSGSSSPNQFFAVADILAPLAQGGPQPARRFVGHFEIGHNPVDSYPALAPAWRTEHEYGTPESPCRQTPGHRWHLLTFYWDFLNPDQDLCGRLYVNDGLAPADKGEADTYGGGGVPNEPSYASDLTLPDRTGGGGHKIALGNRRDGFYDINGYLCWGADATFDEFAVYDLGGSDPAVPPVGTLALKRYREGRYYKGARYYPPDAPAFPRDGEAGSCTTAPIALPAGAVLQKVLWTWYPPAKQPGDYAETDYPEVELLDASGAGWLWATGAESRATRAAGWTPQARSWEVRRPVPGSFRARVAFLRQPGVNTDAHGTLNADSPVVDSPVLDDLTFVYGPSGGPRLLAWGPGD